MIWRETSWSTPVLVSRLVLGGLFVYASLEKIAHPLIFAELIYNYRILPAEAVNLSSLILPWVEFLAGALLISGRLTLPSASILILLILAFCAAVGFNLARGLDFKCGCFTTSPQAKSAGLETLFTELALLVPAALCLAGPFLKKARVPDVHE